MDPYAKALRISVVLHATVAAALAITVLLGETLRPRPSAVFTLRGAPAGMLAGGPASTQAAAPAETPLVAPVGPKLPSPAPAHELEAAARPETPVAPSIAPPKPKPNKKTTENGALPKSKPAQKTKINEKLSFNEFQKKYAPKTPTKQVAKPRAPTGPTRTQVAPSWEENLASRLNRRAQDQGERSVGTGLGGAPGSGMAGDGTPGATLDADALYSGALYTYLNSVWEEPREVGSIRLSARVEFVVDKQGTITGWRITRQSGNESFDRSVEKVFGRVREVAPPPTRQDYRLSVTFETRDS